MQHGGAARAGGHVADLVAGPFGEALDAEEHGGPARLLRDPGDQRVVGVGDEGHVGQLFEHLLPARRQPVDLAVAVQLVAEQVGEHDGAGWAQTAHGERGDGLVYFEQGEPGVGSPREGGGDAGEQVGALEVVHDLPSGVLQHQSGHVGRGRLAVGAGDDGKALGEAGRVSVQVAGEEAIGDLARQAARLTGAGELDGARQRARREAGKQFHAGHLTRRTLADAAPRT